jgi:branched-chain amino acid transport system ATP-binding protein
MTQLLELRGVRARYGDAAVLHGVDLSVGAGETVGLLGRNGAGKTTTVLSIFGVPTVAGEVLVDGKPIGRKRWDVARSGLSLVPQGRGIIAGLSVEENLKLGMAAHRTTQWTLPAVYELFPNLRKASRRRGTALSGGEQQMLAIGRALLSGPRLLLLDEPSEGLAPVAIDRIVDVLKEIQDRGTSILLVEQNMRLVQRLAERFVALGRGTVAIAGPTEDLASRHVQEIIGL